MNVSRSGARRVIKLDSQGAFHSKYLKDINTEFKYFLKDYKFENKKSNNANIYYNYTGNKEDNTNDNIHTLLEKQIYSRVKFMQIIENMLDDGINTFYEIGNGGNLAFHINSIAKAKNKEIKVYKINKYEDYIGVI